MQHTELSTIRLIADFVFGFDHRYWSGPPVHSRPWSQRHGSSGDRFDWHTETIALAKAGARCIIFRPRRSV